MFLRLATVIRGRLAVLRACRRFASDPSTTEIYTLSLHDALPICAAQRRGPRGVERDQLDVRARARRRLDRKSTRLNSSHRCISYAVFCLKKKMFSRDR